MRLDHTVILRHSDLSYNGLLTYRRFNMVVCQLTINIICDVIVEFVLFNIVAALISASQQIMP